MMFLNFLLAAKAFANKTVFGSPIYKVDRVEPAGSGSLGWGGGHGAPHPPVSPIAFENLSVKYLFRMAECGHTTLN